MAKQLTRSRTNRRLAGLCGGLGQYFNVDPVIFRLIWVALFFAVEIGLFAYIIACLIIPNE